MYKVSKIGYVSIFNRHVELIKENKKVSRFVQCTNAYYNIFKIMDIKGRRIV